MVKINLGTAIISAIMLAGCEPATSDEPPPPPPTEPSGQAALDQIAEAEAAKPDLAPAQEVTENVPEIQTAKIKWNKARQDMASQSATDEPLVSIASADGQMPPVPVLLPSGGSVSVASGGSGPRFKQTETGYYAVYQYENYDVIVNGTNEVIGARAEEPRDETMKFTATAAGGQVALSRYGADYLVEFECYTIDPATGTCIEEEEAIGVAESLVIRGTR